jgi:tRNA(Ile)-lysidine synthase
LLLLSPFDLSLEAPPPVVAVACSGGRDSTALLHATVQASIPLNRKVVALHVHHGLNPQADAWLVHVQRQCESWAHQGWPVRFEAHRLQTNPSPGLSIEAWARQARYAALLDMALRHGAPWVLLAHHRQDQAETFLLQALRGAGLAGLSAMPRVADRNGVMWMRPWLDVSSEAIAAYVHLHGLSHIEDDSNQDTRFARNRLRQDIWPHLTSAFAQAPSALAQSTKWVQEAAQCLAELAEQDLNLVATTEGLYRQAWLRLSPPRRSNALRAWFLQQTGQSARATLVQRLMAELPASNIGRWPCVQGELRLYRGVLRYVTRNIRSLSLLEVASLGSAVTKAPLVVPKPCPQQQALCIQGLGMYEFPAWGGVLNVLAVDQYGIPVSRLKNLEMRQRQGGEQFQSGPFRPPRSLKKQYQAAGIPAWQRSGPLVCDEKGHLVFVPGLGMDARQWAHPDVDQLALAWLPL